MNTDLPQLEQTIIDIARQELAAVAAFYRKREAGIESAHVDEAWSEYLARYHALSTLLVLGQLPIGGEPAELGKNRTLRFSELPQRPEFPVFQLAALPPNVIAGQVDVLPAQWRKVLQ